MHFLRKAMIRTFLFLFTTTLSIVFCFGTVHGASEQDVVAENHFVIMYDISTSMKDADFRIKGMIADFLLSVPSEQYPYKIAIIPFATKCPETDMLQNGKVNWWEIQTENGETKEKIIHALHGLEYTGEYTDIEAALQYCKETLNDMRSSGYACRQTVLFITDGVVDVPGDTPRIHIDNIIESAKRIPDIAKEFPDDCKFYAIIPDDVSKSALVEYDSNGDNIISYYKVSVKTDQQKGIDAALTCLEEFCRQMNMSQEEGKADRAEIIAMDWTENTFQNFRIAYNKFFESMWDTSIVMKESVNLSDGLEFSLLDGIAEANITVIPEIEDEDQCRKIVEQLLNEGMIFVTRGDLEQKIEIEDSIHMVNVKLVNPPKGTYHLRTIINERCYFSLNLVAYNDLTIAMREQNITAPLGTTVLLEGNIVDSKGTAVTAQTARNLSLEVFETDEIIEGIEGSEVTLKNDEFQYNFTVRHIGSNPLVFRIEYDDTNDTQIPNGISKFGHQEMITIEVPEVSYGGEVRQYLFSKADYVLQPYSTISGEQVNVSAEATMKYLDDDWVLRLFDKQGAQMNTDAPLQISEDGECFILQCKSKDVASAVMFNRTTNMSIDLEIPASSNKFLPFFLAVIVIVIIIVMALNLTTLRVNVYRKGHSKSVHIKKDGHSRPITFEDKNGIVYYDMANEQVVAHFDDLTIRRNVNGHRCHIDFGEVE